MGSCRRCLELLLLLVAGSAHALEPSPAAGRRSAQAAVAELQAHVTKQDQELEKIARYRRPTG